MITAIITTLNDEARLAATLSALAPAAIDSFVREVIVADGGSSDGTLALAEESGARIVAGRRDKVVAEASALARQPWLLILPAGARLQLGWEAAVRGHIRRHPAAGGWFRLNVAEPGVGARLDEVMADLSARWLGRLRPEQGLLISARQFGASRTPSYRLGARILIGADVL